MKRFQVNSEDVFIWGLMAIAFFIMVAKLNHIIEYTFIGLLLFWICLKVKKGDFYFVRTPLLLPIGLFVGWALITIPFAVNPSYSLAELRKTVIQLLIFFFVVNVVNNERQVCRILQSFFAGLILLTWFGVFEQLLSDQSLWDETSDAASLTSAGQWFSTYIVMGIPFVWFFFMKVRVFLQKFC